MRVWDVSPGYLNRQSLLGEHRELHGLHSILVHGKDGYSRHPETVRWVGCLTGLACRHAQLVAEMDLRGYEDRTPIRRRRVGIRWPSVFVTAPSMQLALLASKYVGRESGRIPFPRSAPELWAHHKYSVLARDQDAYRAIGRRVSRLRRDADLASLTEDLVALLRQPPTPGGLVNALEHMWGYVSAAATPAERKAAQRSQPARLRTTRELVRRVNEPYLRASTALSELAIFL